MKVKRQQDFEEPAHRVSFSHELMQSKNTSNQLPVRFDGSDGFIGQSYIIPLQFGAQISWVLG